VVAPATPLLRDEFTDTNGTNLTAHTIEPYNEPATVWSALMGTMTVESNRAQDGAEAVYTLDAGVADIVLTCDILPGDAATPGTEGILTRASNNDNYNLSRWEQFGNQIAHYEKIGGGFNLRVTTALSPSIAAEPYTMIITTSGQQTIVDVGGTTASYSSSVRETVTKHGLRLATGTGNGKADNFQIEDNS
jgi:hypothetical protein